MRTSLYLATALAVGAAVVMLPATPAQAQTVPPSEQQYASPLIPPKLPPQQVPQEVKAAWGCVLMGSAGTVAALGANSVNLLNVVAGGIVTPANPAVLYLGLTGVVFTTFCTLGQQLTPLYTYYFGTEPEPETAVAKAQPAHPRVASVAAPRPVLTDDEEPAYPWLSAR